MKPILTVCAEAAEALNASAATAASLSKFMSPPKEASILNEPCAAQRGRQRDGVAGGGAAHREPHLRATRDEGFRPTAGKRIAGERGRGGSAGEQRFPLSN